MLVQGIAGNSAAFSAYRQKWLGTADSGSSEKTICTPRSVLQGLLKVQHSFHALSCKWNRSQHGVGDILNYHHWQSYQTSDEVKFSLPEISLFSVSMDSLRCLRCVNSTGRRGVSKVPFRLTSKSPASQPHPISASGKIITERIDTVS